MKVNKDELEFIDVSEKKTDKFMVGVVISLIILVLLGGLTYFFGYDLLKPFIKV